MSNPPPAKRPAHNGLQRLLAPGVALMNRLSYPRKFLLISLLFVLPLALVVYLLFSEIGEQIEFARKETKGIRYLAPVRRLLGHVTDSRMLAHDYAAGRVAVRPQLVRTQEEIAADCAALAVVEADLGGVLRTGTLARALQKNWGFLRAKMLRLEAADLDELHAQLLQDVQALIARVRDTSNLILDPELDSYYLMDAVLLRLPEAAQLSGRARIQGKKSLAGDRPLSGPDKESFTGLAALLRANLDATRSGLGVAFRSPAGGCGSRANSAAAAPSTSPPASGRGVARWPARPGATRPGCGTWPCWWSMTTPPTAASSMRSCAAGP
jgi:hypothetical protein